MAGNGTDNSVVKVQYVSNIYSIPGRAFGQLLEREEVKRRA
jgi:hypothetical protein